MGRRLEMEVRGIVARKNCISRSAEMLVEAAAMLIDAKKKKDKKVIQEMVDGAVSQIREAWPELTRAGWLTWYED